MTLLSRNTWRDTLATPYRLATFCASLKQQEETVEKTVEETVEEQDDTVEEQDDTVEEQDDTVEEQEDTVEETVEESVKEEEIDIIFRDSSIRNERLESVELRDSGINLNNKKSVATSSIKVDNSW